MKKVTLARIRLELEGEYHYGCMAGDDFIGTIHVEPLHTYSMQAHSHLFPSKYTVSALKEGITAVFKDNQRCHSIVSFIPASNKAAILSAMKAGFKLKCVLDNYIVIDSFAEDSQSNTDDVKVLYITRRGA